MPRLLEPCNQRKAGGDFGPHRHILFKKNIVDGYAIGHLLRPNQAARRSMMRGAPLLERRAANIRRGTREDAVAVEQDCFDYHVSNYAGCASGNSRQYRGQANIAC